MMGCKWKIAYHHLDRTVTVDLPAHAVRTASGGAHWQEPALSRSEIADCRLESRVACDLGNCWESHRLSYQVSGRMLVRTLCH